MLRIAVQSKGRLYDETMMLLEEAGIRLNKGKRILLLAAKGFPVEVLFLRADDIPESVANGVADVGIVGDLHAILPLVEKKIAEIQAAGK